MQRRRSSSERIDSPTLKHLCAQIVETPPGRLHRLFAGAQPSWTLIRWRALRIGDRRIRRALGAHQCGRIESFHDLKIVTALLALIEDHDRFEACLRCHDAALTHPDANWRRRFHGTGVGSESLNVYRLLEGPDGHSFEKTYRRDAEGFRIMAFIHEAVLPRVEGVGYPALRDLRHGNRLALAYFDAIEVAPPATFDVEAAAQAVRALTQTDLGGLDAPPEVTEFARGNFRRYRAALQERIRGAYPGQADAALQRLQNCEDEVRQYPIVLCHGDLNRHNFSGYGHILDWDLAGFFPYGYDPAYIAALARPFKRLSVLEEFYSAHFRRGNTDTQDARAFHFFFLHFMQKYPRQKRNDRLFHQLVRRLNLVPARRRPRAAGRHDRPSTSAPSRRSSNPAG